MLQKNRSDRGVLPTHHGECRDLIHHLTHTDILLPPRNHSLSFSSLYFNVALVFACLEVVASVLMLPWR